MKGLRQYIARHGRHFTIRLAGDVLECKWNHLEVEKATEARVYYNVSGATLGDMVFLINLFSDSFPKRRCVGYALEIVGDVSKEGYAFDAWVMGNEDIDLREYI